ncbi:unnamed protein product [Arabidopsis thaliana]|uniref:(thale cress) hypothetical protein n=1 Tax=Arabidopsis thaliana TaxID=3702 RepID=A0A7G2E726_ARATH|nr:unnamed protein product [Arabidopsis thaliana]
MNCLMFFKMLLAFSFISLFYVGNAQQSYGNSTVSALFAFGDSILDTGNNNLLLSVSKVNFYPYGRDFIAEGLGLKNLLPAYRDPYLWNNDLTTGVCFASGGSGLDPITARTTGSIWVSDQVTDFQNYITRLNGVVGNQEQANASLYDMGARKFAVMGTLPLGCLPGARALTRACELFVNQGAAMFNQQLSADIDNLGATFPGAKFVYVDMYNPLLGLIINPQPSGFIDVADACCCTPTHLIPCLDASRYVFWDVAHPTQKSYETIAPQIIENIKAKLA